VVDRAACGARLDTASPFPPLTRRTEDEPTQVFGQKRSSPASVPREEGFAIARMTLPRGRWAHLGGSLEAVGYSARTARMKSGQTSGTRLARP